MFTTIPNLFKLDDLRGKLIKLILVNGEQYICIPRDFTPIEGRVAYTVEIVEGEDSGYSIDVYRSGNKRYS